MESMHVGTVLDSLLEVASHIDQQVQALGKELESTNKILTENTALIKEMLGLWHIFLQLMKERT